MWDRFKYIFVSCEHWNQSRFVFGNLQSVFFTPVVYGWSVVCIIFRMSEREGPCIMIIMSSAKTSILTFASLESTFITSLMIIFQKVGPETDPWGQPLVTRFELREFPSVTWAVRSLKKSFTMSYVFGGHFIFLSRARIPGCQALSKAPAMSRARRQHLSPRFLLRPTKSETDFMASAVDLPAVKPNFSGDICPVVSRK